MAVRPIPAKLAAKISKCWPDGVIEEFDTDESYFREERWPLEQDVRKIQGASLLYQTKSEELHSWDDDDGDLPRSDCDEFQSYHVFFLAPDDPEFQFEDETESLANPDDPEPEQWPDGVIPGQGWFGWAVGISLVARFAVFNPCQYSQYEDGTRDIPDVESFICCDQTNERMEKQLYYRKVLGDQSYQKLLDLRGRIAAVLREYRIELLDEAVLDLAAGVQGGSGDFPGGTSVRARCVLFSRHLMGHDHSESHGYAIAMGQSGF
jgi:hypothetical protein